ncbi:MAG: SDR family oxidoreductase [Gammaproteobacteria bacterium]|nr:MAG: SDR family oxidoreductase [Gammaproteobacteria bacterium]
MTQRLQQRVVLVFGAGSCGPGWSNGKAAAVAYAREGARVVAIDRLLERAQETRDLVQQEGGSCLALAGDVTSAADIDAVVGAAQSAFGTVDVLHYNVGISGFRPLTELSEAAWEQTFAANLKGAFLASRRVLPIMLAQGRGVITTISSTASLAIGPIPFVDYYASKAGLNQFTRSVAIAYAKQGIRANVVAPGLMNTPLLLETPGFLDHYGTVENMVRARGALSPTGAMGDAWDIAHAAVFLASDEARYINGVVLPVDGGLHCRLG